MGEVESSTVVLNAMPVESPTRRLDVEQKQVQVSRLLNDTGCEGLLLLNHANFRRFTSGGHLRGLFGADEAPALYFSDYQRWILCNNVDSPRLFDEEVDGLGFQLKEWPWHGNRESLLAELCMGRRIACDTLFRDCKFVGSFLDRERRRLTRYEQDRMRELGKFVVHAVEATARSVSRGDSEEEIAGHLSHRLLRHGVEPVMLHVASDGRGNKYRRLGPNPIRAEYHVVIQVTGRKFGLHATAARTLVFGEPDEVMKREFDYALRVSAIWLAMGKSNQLPSVTLEAARNVLSNTRFEHEWRLAPAGCWTGYEPSEGVLTTQTQERLVPGNAIVWQSRIGGAAVCDTFLLNEQGWESITPILEWPTRRIIIGGVPYDRPDLIMRTE